MLLGLRVLKGFLKRAPGRRLAAVGLETVITIIIIVAIMIILLMIIMIIYFASSCRGVLLGMPGFDFEGATGSVLLS